MLTLAVALDLKVKSVLKTDPISWSMEGNPGWDVVWDVARR